MQEQRVIYVNGAYSELDAWFQENGIQKLLLVCDSALPFLQVNSYFEDIEGRFGIKVVKFSDFQPNPLYESVVEGVTAFHRNGCDAIFAVGGGSAIDVAKCIKLYANMYPHKNYLHQQIVPNNIPFIAMPTTAGTGSEATRYAVIYYNGEKQSVTHESCIPRTVVMEPSVLMTLPVYQKKATMLDAFCHAVESFWSVNSTEESKAYSAEAIREILKYKDAYLQNEKQGNACMLKAAHIAGRAINITQTTAGHAMCYKLTSLYGIAHGHAAALCVAVLWPYMLDNVDRCIDPRGTQYLQKTFQEIADVMGCKTPQAAAEQFRKILCELELAYPVTKDRETELEILSASVNLVRLKNNPVELDRETLKKLYEEIL